MNKVKRELLDKLYDPTKQDKRDEQTCHYCGYFPCPYCSILSE